MFSLIFLRCRTKGKGKREKGKHLLVPSPKSLVLILRSIFIRLIFLKKLLNSFCSNLNPSSNDSPAKSAFSSKSDRRKLRCRSR